MPGSKRAKKVTLQKYGSGSNTIHNELDNLINSHNATVKSEKDDIIGDRCTVIITVPKKWGVSFTDRPGHAGIALWNSTTNDYQSLGILTNGKFLAEEINVHNDEIKEDDDYKIWYFTKVIDKKTYDKLRLRMATLAPKALREASVFVYRGWREDSSYSCVTAVDTILVAGGLSWAIASLSSAPYAYAQTFTTISWDCSYADGMKHM